MSSLDLPLSLSVIATSILLDVNRCLLWCRDDDDEPDDDLFDLVRCPPPLINTSSPPRGRLIKPLPVVELVCPLTVCRAVLRSKIVHFVILLRNLIGLLFVCALGFTKFGFLGQNK